MNFLRLGRCTLFDVLPERPLLRKSEGAEKFGEGRATRTHQQAFSGQEQASASPCAKRAEAGEGRSLQIV